MGKDFNKPISLIPQSTIAIPITETVAKMLKTMFNSQLGSLELILDQDGFNSPQLVISCYLSNEENTKWDDLKKMYSVKQLDDYNKLRQLVYQIINDYYALEDAKIVNKNSEQENWGFEWEEDEHAEF